MKKIIIVLFIISIGFLFMKKDDEILIPEDAIRFRVIANSDTLEDQTQKMVIKDNIEKEVYSLITGAKTSNDVKNILKDKMDTIDEVVSKYNVPYHIDYGYNYFPSKTYKGVVYGAGNYESLVITLGNGAGKNFWCVLFPPLCLLDNTEDLTEVEYKSYVKEVLDKF